MITFISNWYNQCVSSYFRIILNLQLKSMILCDGKVFKEKHKNSPFGNIKISKWRFNQHNKSKLIKFLNIHRKMVVKILISLLCKILWFSNRLVSTTRSVSSRRKKNCKFSTKAKRQIVMIVFFAQIDKL